MRFAKAVRLFFFFFVISWFHKPIPCSFCCSSQKNKHCSFVLSCSLRFHIPDLYFPFLRLPFWVAKRRKRGRKGKEIKWKLKICQPNIFKTQHLPNECNFPSFSSANLAPLNMQVGCKSQFLHWVCLRAEYRHLSECTDMCTWWESSLSTNVSAIEWVGSEDTQQCSDMELLPSPFCFSFPFLLLTSLKEPGDAAQ